MFDKILKENTWTWSVGVVLQYDHVTDTEKDWFWHFPFYSTDIGKLDMEATFSIEYKTVYIVKYLCLFSQNFNYRIYIYIELIYQELNFKRGKTEYVSEDFPVL